MALQKLMEYEQQLLKKKNKKKTTNPEIVMLASSKYKYYDILIHTYAKSNHENVIQNMNLVPNPVGIHLSIMYKK